MTDQCVIGIDLGTSAVKLSAMTRNGELLAQSSRSYPVFQKENGFVEQDPNDWFEDTYEALKEILTNNIVKNNLVGISFSGQMHSLVLLDNDNKIIRPAILWNDTRTTEEVEYINKKFKHELINITGNKATEGFTLTKLLWVKKHEPENFAKIKKFMMPKDYVRFVLTGKINTDYSDATGTVLLDLKNKKWSSEICQYFGIPLEICPNLVESTAETGLLVEPIQKALGLTHSVHIFAGCGDNAAGALGAGIIKDNQLLCSIGTSGVILSAETINDPIYAGKLQMECHSVPNKFYSMGVTLSAGNSFKWFKNVFVPDKKFSDLIQLAKKSSIGAHGVIFTPYLNGERTPYTDSNIRGSFIGLSSNTQFKDLTRAVIEGITYSLKDIENIYLSNHKNIQEIISIGGGAKSKFWLQLQANVFNKKIVTLKNEQGPGIGAAMIATMGLNWFRNWEECLTTFVHYGKIYLPEKDQVIKYNKVYKIYQQVYFATQPLTKNIMNLSK